MTALPPILISHLFRPLDGLLLTLLRSLRDSDWELPTVAGHWRVKDVAAHLLDTQLRKLSLARDGYVCQAFNPQEDLVTFINRLNQDGVTFLRRLSPPVLIALMDVACREGAAYHEALDPFAEAVFSVSWAGEERSLNWFDTAREFTERWHHQQQIRLAVGRAGIMTPAFYHPVLDCFMRALPFAYRHVFRDPGTVAEFRIDGPCGGNWFLHREAKDWHLIMTPPHKPSSTTCIPEDVAWLIFTKGLKREVAAAQVQVDGDLELGGAILGVLAIVG